MKLEKLRGAMAENKIDTYIITKFDPHQSENAADHWNGVKWISGFSGSAATVVVTREKAGLWTDGRYYIQAEQEISGSGLELYREPEPDTISIEDFCLAETPSGGSVGFDGRTLSKEAADRLEKIVADKKISLRMKDLLEGLWDGRPERPSRPVFEHSISYCGISRADKIKKLREAMERKKAGVYFISSLDDIAWLLNLRGGDVQFLTVFFSYLAITQDTVHLFIDSAKVENIKEMLARDNITLEAYEEVFSYAEKIPRDKTVMFAAAATCQELYKNFAGCACIELESDLTTEWKALKNETELQNLAKAHVRDGQAMLRFIKWLKETVQSETVTEYDIGEKLLELRGQGEKFLSPSFATIAAYMDNAAMMHYSAKKEACKALEPHGFVLVDSGGHYLDGTTDITRTIVLGELTREMKRDFTLVLKSMIALSRAKFLYGTTGTQLDVFARSHMWENLMDYKSGTGHGIGFCLNVHEGPHRVSPRLSSVRIEPGMVFTNEPGVYKQGRWGIRTENILVVKEAEENEFGRFMRTETISFCPIDVEAIEVSMLTREEKDWVNEYHRLCFEKLSPGLTEGEKEFLKKETCSI